MPVWHVSVTVRSPDNTRLRREPALAEREGVTLLAGVGNDHEWWMFSPTMVGHVRVGADRRREHHVRRVRPGPGDRRRRGVRAAAPPDPAAT